MLHIILLVLKIIGIVLLCIVGLVLLAIACVLFVPVRYRISLVREEGEDKPPLVVKAKVTWLLHLLNVRIRYPLDRQYVRARIFLFTVFSMPEKERKAARKNQASVGHSAAGKEEKHTSKKVVRSEIQIEDAHRPSADEPEQGETSEKAKAETAEKPMSGQEEAAPDEKLSLFQKLKKILQLLQNFSKKIKEIVQNIQCTIEHFCDKIKSVLNNIAYYQEIVESDVFQNSLRLCKDELIRVLKRLRPQKMQADLIIGMADPATTGQILAVWGMLYPFIGEHVNIVGDFEQTRIEGQAFIKGRISIITFVRIVVRIYFNQDVKKLLKLLKKEAA
jgi:hypothetical protein